MFFLYILYSESKDRFYIGSTAKLDERINRHNSGRSKATKAARPWKLMYLWNGLKGYVTNAQNRIKIQIYSNDGILLKTINNNTSISHFTLTEYSTEYT